MWIEPGTHAQGPMARDAVSLRVAADAPAEPSLGFEGMMPGARRGVAPYRLGRVKPATVPGVEWARLGYPGPDVAVETEALLQVAALASLRTHPCLDGVHIEVVIRVDRSWADPSIVAVGAERVLMAACAERRIVAGHTLVPRQEIGRVLRIPHPGRWVESARCEHRLHAPAGHRRMACVAGALGVATGGRIRHRVAAKAPPHARELVPSREVQSLDRPMALGATDVARRVSAMTEDEVGARSIHGRHDRAVLG
jgi:hypothetical protein